MFEVTTIYFMEKYKKFQIFKKKFKKIQKNINKKIDSF